MEYAELFSDDLDTKVKLAVSEAIQNTLAAGVPIFYRDPSGLDVMQQSDGRKFEIRYIADAAGDHNHEIIRELIRTVA